MPLLRLLRPAAGAPGGGVVLKNIWIADKNLKGIMSGEEGEEMNWTVKK